MAGYCTGPDCTATADRGELCFGHVKQQQRDGRLSPLREKPSSPRERLREAALAYAEADGDDDYRRADDNLDKAAAAFARRHAGKAIADSLHRRRAQGLPVGRPPTGVSRWAAQRRRQRETVRNSDFRTS